MGIMLDDFSYGPFQGGRVAKDQIPQESVKPRVEALVAAQQRVVKATEELRASQKALKAAQAALVESYQSGLPL